MKNDIKKIPALANVRIYDKSIHEIEGTTYFVARTEKGKAVGAVGPQSSISIAGTSTRADANSTVVLAPMTPANAASIRKALRWTAPSSVGLSTSVGLGDRLGCATPGHVRAIRGSGLTAVLAQQSIREMKRTRRTPQEVIDAATWGVLEAGYRDGFGSDADHLQEIEDIDNTRVAGFISFTIDPGKHVVSAADTMAVASLKEQYARLSFLGLRATPDEMRKRYSDKSFPLSGGAKVGLSAEEFLRAAVKYGNAVAHTARMSEHIRNTVGSHAEIEISVDETDAPTSPAEHYFVVSELKRLGVSWTALAPRFVGRFEKGVDYQGDVPAFRSSFAVHVAVMKALGPYKISVHSGSDKFTIYPIVSELTGGLVHLKTAGTSYLEALRAVSRASPSLFREILAFAIERYETDKQSYHVSADMSRVPDAGRMKDAQLESLLNHFDVRQALHVSFGSVLTADDGERFKKRIFQVLDANEEVHYSCLEEHMRRHISPFTRK